MLFFNFTTLQPSFVCFRCSVQNRLGFFLSLLLLNIKYVNKTKMCTKFRKSNAVINHVVIGLEWK